MVFTKVAVTADVDMGMTFIDELFPAVRFHGFAGAEKPFRHTFINWMLPSVLKDQKVFKIPISSR
jgi:hypothetical protein